MFDAANGNRDMVFASCDCVILLFKIIVSGLLAIPVDLKK